MKIVADLDTCQGLGMCEAMSHELFEVGDEGHVLILNDSPDESERTDVQAAVDACPVSALRLDG